MNGTDPRPEIAALLPALGDEVSGMSPDRHRALRAHLTAEIRRGTRRERVSARARGLTMIGALAGLLAAVIGVTWLLRPAPPGEPRSPGLAELSSPGPDDTLTAAFLDRAALAALSGAPADPVIPPDAFVYLRSLVAATTMNTGPETPLPVIADLHERELWRPQRTGPDGLLIEYDVRSPQTRIAGNAEAATLPTDPGRLLEQVYSTVDGRSLDREAAAFAVIRDHLHESLLPAAVRVSLIRAAARIPGATVLADRVDAAGRHGAAVTLASAGTRTTLIFEISTLEYLGERVESVDDGRLISIGAVLERAVVDRAGQRR